MQKVFVKYNSLNNSIINTYLLSLGDILGTKKTYKMQKRTSVYIDFCPLFLLESIMFFDEDAIF